MSPTAVVYGESRLAVSIIKSLLAEKVRVIRIVSECPLVAKFARQERIPLGASYPEAAAFLSDVRADLLLSVVHLRPIPVHVLERFTLAVNYHDGPLPEMGGLNNSAWAVLNGHKTHGITWHVMTKAIDAGAILVRRTFTVDADETALSLNMKCADACLDSFAELLPSLLDPDRVAKAEKGENPRKVWLRRHRPPDRAIISGRTTVAEADRLLRGLNFGPYTNHLAVPGLWTGGRHHGIREGRTVARGQGRPPGDHVYELADGWLQVTRFYGPPPDPGPAGAPPAGSSERLAAGTRDEEFWWRTLAPLPPCPLPDCGSGDPVEQRVALSGSVAEKMERVAQFLMALTGGRSDFYIPVHQETKEEEGFFPEEGVRVPVRTDGTAPFRAALQHRPYTLDFWWRWQSGEDGEAAPAGVHFSAGSLPHRGPGLAFAFGGDGVLLRGGQEAGRLAPLLQRFAESTGEPAAFPWLAGPEFADCLHGDFTPLTGPDHLIPMLEEAVRANRERIAVTTGDASLTYGELDRLSNGMARHLQERLPPGAPVGLHLQRSPAAVAALLGIVRAGLSWVPLDPEFPEERLRYMAEDAGLGVIIADPATCRFPPDDDRLLMIDTPGQGYTGNPPAVQWAATDTAYIIYTSGSTGRPKGVVISHGQLANFFAGMDAVIPPGGKVWLALTSLSFDISILELIWTLTRGFTLVIGEQTPAAIAGGDELPEDGKQPSFSLFYFGATPAGEQKEQDQYRLLLEGARFADENGFAAVWTPERHFAEFGGPYPNPAVAGAAIAAITSRVGIRAGSCVAPLHSPYRIAEEWAVVDRLSGGRAGLAFASGWHPGDFVIRPDDWQDRHRLLYERTEEFLRLWQGQSLPARSPTGEEMDRHTFPRPQNPQVPVWITAAGNIATYREAGRRGLRILTHLLGQDFNELAGKLQAYRDAWQPGISRDDQPYITLMLHTYVGQDEAAVRERCREPMKAYLKTAASLVQQAAWSFPTFTRRSRISGESVDDIMKDGIDDETMDALLDHAYERYAAGSSLIGTPASLTEVMSRIRDLGVDEIGCLIDFGLPVDTVLQGLEQLKILMQPPRRKKSLVELVEQHGVTHMQSTPTFARMLLLEARGQEVLQRVPHYLVGGEALPPALAQELLGKLPGNLYNMYGPTETTIWSTAGRVTGDTVDLGRPIHGTRLYILDEHLQQAPPGQEGELWIGGASVATGYHDRPELTTDRFRQDPFTADPGARIYRTGDLVRLTLDGRLLYLGRNDFQVKIRGHRIEMGEVENRLENLAGVRQAVVVARTGADGAARGLVAFIVPDDESVDAADLKVQMGAVFAGYMVPEQIRLLPSLPRTPNQKVDRSALTAMAEKSAPVSHAPADEPVPSHAPADTTSRARVHVNTLLDLIKGVWADALQLESVADTVNFFDAGGHSLLAFMVNKKTQDLLQITIPIVAFFRAGTPAALAAWIMQEFPDLNVPSDTAPASGPAVTKDTFPAAAAPVAGATPTASGGRVAVIGMAGRFPGADDTDALHRQLQAGADCTRAVPLRELLRDGLAEDTVRDPAYVRRTATLSDPYGFDAAFFGLSPREAEIMDPQHRHFLEVCWHAFEDAGYGDPAAAGIVGLFAGSSIHKYMMANLWPNRNVMERDSFFLVRHTGNDKDFLTTRVSYSLGLTGPSVAVQTACSTSLVAIHIACQSLQRGECELALAGGTSIEQPAGHGYRHEKGGVTSPDGVCRPFSDDAVGTFFGSGAGVVLLKPLAKALEDGDRIHCVIEGSAVGNDGDRKVGYLAPSVEGQRDTAVQALRDAGIAGREVGYLETHGTGTILGDPIEIQAMTEAYGRRTDGEPGCAIGSIKANMGHLDTAAGVAGFIKAALAVREDAMPPLIHFNGPNPHIDWQTSPFYPLTERRPWPAGRRRLAAVNSTGVGGTNAHIIISEPPQRQANPHAAPAWRPVILSGPDEGILDAMGSRLQEWLGDHPDADLGAVAAGMARRKQFSANRILLSESVAGLRDQLGGGGDARLTVDMPTTAGGGLVFMFPGGGAQYPGMAAGLYRRYDSFRQDVDGLLQVVENRYGADLRPCLFPPDGEQAAAVVELGRMPVMMVALFIIEHSLARLLERAGLKAEAMTGHSLGEYTAATLAGVMSPEDAVHLLWHRGRLSASVRPGAMLSVDTGVEAITPLLPEGVVVSVENSPRSTVLSGPGSAIAALEKELNDAGEMDARRILVRGAAHSHLLDPVLDEFREICEQIRFRPPRRPFISNRTGTFARAEEVVDPGYWVRHLREPVLFGRGLEILLAEGPRVLLEVGPGRSLGFFAAAVAETSGREATIVGVLPVAKEAGRDQPEFLAGLCRLRCAGQPVDDTFLFGGTRPAPSLPLYPFQHKTWYVAPVQADTPGAGEPDREKPPGPVRYDQPESWFYQAVTVPVAEPEPEDPDPEALVVISAADCPAAQRFLAGVPVTASGPRWLEWGNGYERDGRRWRLAPSRQELERFLAEADLPEGPLRVVNFTALHGDHRAIMVNGLFGMMHLLRAHEDMRPGGEIRLDVVTEDLFTDAEIPRPQQALLLALPRVLPREFDGLTVCLQDLQGMDYQSVAAGSGRGSVLIHRSSGWWTPDFRRTIPDITAPRPVEGCVLITGGLGGMGLTLAGYLLEEPGVRVALLSRQQYLRPGLTELAKDPLCSDGERARFERIMELDPGGKRCRIVHGDVNDKDGLARAVRHVEQELGPVTGVLHAAGVVDDAPLLLKDEEQIARVLAPKVQGTLHLEEVLSHRELEFFVAFSSSSVLTGPAGQVDYVAANAWLNSYVESRRRRPRFDHHRGTRFLSLLWGMWRGIGMAGHMQRFHGRSRVQPEPVPHPGLQKRLFRSDQKTVYEAVLTRDEFWFISEHRVRDGLALMPGTGFLELARAAVRDQPGDAGLNKVLLSDVLFLQPFTVPGGQRVLLQTEVRCRQPRRFEVLFHRVLESGRLHTVCTMQAGVMRGSAERQNVDDLTEKLATAAWKPPAGLQTGQERHLDFGPRWQVLGPVRHGGLHSFARLSLDRTFRQDLTTFRLHPALLDLATGFCLDLFPGYDPDHLHVPVSYRRVHIYRDMEAEVRALAVRLYEDAGAGRFTVNVTICNAAGHVLCAVEGLTMQRVGTLQLPAEPADDPSAMIDLGLSPDEGRTAFDRMLRHGGSGPWLISPVDRADLSADDRQPEAAAPDGEYGSELTDPVEKVLAGLFGEILAIRQPDAGTSFFDLGGHSLFALRLLARIRQHYDVEIPMSALFSAPTIRQLAALLRRELPDPGPAPAAPEGSDSDERDAPASTQLVEIARTGTDRNFFCVHGAGGNVLNFYPLSQVLGDSCSFYGLQDRGIDSQAALNSSIEEMAASYTEDILRVQSSGLFYLGGYSGGGVVALEIANRLTRRGHRVARVFMFDTICHLVPPMAGPGKWAEFSDVLGRLRPLDTRSWGQVVGWPWKKAGNWLEGRRNSRQIREYLDYAARGQRAPERLRETELFQKFQDLAEKHPGRHYDHPVTLFRACDPLKEFAWLGDDLGWRPWIDKLEVFPVASGHHSIMAEPAVLTLGSKIAVMMNDQ